MSSFATPTISASYPRNPTAPPKRKASTAAIDENGEHSNRGISPDSRRRRVKSRTVSASDNRKRPILQPIANTPTAKKKRAALQEDLTTLTNTDSEIALGYESGIKDSKESTKETLSEAYHDDMFFNSATLKEIYEDYIAEEKKLKESIAALEHDIMVTRERNVKLERELTAKVGRLCLDDVE